MRLVLASASPRRRQLLARLGLEFDVVLSDVDETLPPDVPLGRAVAELARRKARAVATRLGAIPLPGDRAVRSVVLGADTLVVLDGQPFGKPVSRPDARRMLEALRGRTHEVVTGVAVVEMATGREAVETVTSRVTMRAFDDAELDAYLRTGEPDDKAGAYALQGVGGRLVLAVEGSSTNVIGLPIEATIRLLRQAGLAVSEPPVSVALLGLTGAAESDPGPPAPR
jgi:septum formation protein